jgi:PST family polysaccharide transporter
MEDLKARAVSGGFAKLWAQRAVFTLRMGSLMILARILEPKDFGLVTMVTSVTGVLEIFRDAGLSTASVQRQTISQNQLSTLFWINLLVGGILSLASLLIAPILTDFYHEPKLFWITVALAVTFLFNAAGVQHTALLQRQMSSKTLATEVGRLGIRILTYERSLPIND